MQMLKKSLKCSFFSFKRISKLVGNLTLSALTQKEHEVNSIFSIFKNALQYNIIASVPKYMYNVHKMCCNKINKTSMLTIKQRLNNLKKKLKYQERYGKQSCNSDIKITSGKNYKLLNLQNNVLFTKNCSSILSNHVPISVNT